MTTRALNQSADEAALIANNVAEFVEHELGYDNPGDIIPGLVMAIGLFAAASSDPQRLMDEASDLLSGLDEEDMYIVSEGELIEE